MKILLFTDIHIHSRHKQAESNRLFKAAIDHANTNHTDAAFCILLGDLTWDGQLNEYEELRQEIQTLSQKKYLMLGNHDRQEQFRTVFSDYGFNDNDTVYSVIDTEYFRLLLLNTQTPTGSHGELDAPQLSWLEKHLTESDKPCFICMHHHPLVTGLPAYDRIGLQCSPFSRLVNKYREKIHMIIHGHCHMGLSGSLGGVPVTGVQSLCNQAAPNFRTDEFIDRDNQLASYSVLLTDGINTIIHSITL